MINDLLSDIDKPLENLLFDNPESLGLSHYKFSIYNPYINNPLQKFWFFIKKVKIINKDTNNITIAFSNSNDDNKFIKYILSIESKIIKFVNNINQNIKSINKSIDVRENFPPTMKLKFGTNTPVFNTMDYDDKYNLHTGSYIALFVEINDIIVTKLESWIIWKILQIKILEEIDFSKSLFSFGSLVNNKNVTENIDSHTDIIVPSAPPCPEPVTNTISSPKKLVILSKSNKKPSEPMRISISQNDLLSQIKKLKTVVLTDESKSMIIPPKEINKILDPSEKIINMNKIIKTIKKNNSQSNIGSRYNKIIDKFKIMIC